MNGSRFPALVGKDPIVYSREFLRSSVIDESRRPYVLARVAIACWGDFYFSSCSFGALKSLNQTNAAGELQPPLSVELASEIEAYVDVRGTNSPSAHDLSALALLSAALDEGTRLNG